MENLLKRHLEKRLGEDAPNLERVLSSFEYIKTKRNELFVIVYPWLKAEYCTNNHSSHG